MAATYAYCIARNHPFADGNKRTGLLTALTFLATNGQQVMHDATLLDLMVRAAGEEGFSRKELARAFESKMSHNEKVE